MKTVIYHSADFDGIFCREIARKFLGDKDVQYIGWNFGDKPLMAIHGNDGLGSVYVLDLPVDRPFGFNFQEMKRGMSWRDFLGIETDLTWIDHHKTSIDTHPTAIPGYRIDGVAACRLAWQCFNKPHINGKECALTKEDFIDRKVDEPLAVRLAGEYDVWDKRDERVDVLQYGLRSVNLGPGADFWEALLDVGEVGVKAVEDLVQHGKVSRVYARYLDSEAMRESGFVLYWEGLKFLCLNSVARGSLRFESRDVPETGHDALMSFGYTGRGWTVSLYHAKHRTDLDLSAIAAKHGGGGHRGACGFTCKQLPFAL